MSEGLSESHSHSHSHTVLRFGELAQLARAPALHAGGHRFDSDILHDIPAKAGISIKAILINLIVA